MGYIELTRTKFVNKPATYTVYHTTIKL